MATVFSERIIGLLVASILIGLAILFFWPERSIRNFPTQKSGPIIFFGDSLVEGVGASKNRDMASLLSLALGEPVLNYGVAGDTTETAIARMAAPLEEGPRLVLVVLGGNDFLRKIAREQTVANLEKIITEFQATGAVVLLVGVRSGIIGGGSDELYENVAQKTGAAYEEDILKGVFGNPSLMSDAIHPNDLGYAKIVERLLPTIKNLLNKD